MNKKRISKAVGFSITGIVVLCLLILEASIINILGKLIKDPETLLHAYSFLKYFIIILGIIFIGLGIYNLIMIFVEEEDAIN